MMNKNIRGVTLAIASISAVALGFVVQHSQGLSQPLQTQDLGLLAQSSSSTPTRGIRLNAAGFNLSRIHQQIVLGFYLRVKQEAIAVQSETSTLDGKTADGDQLKDKLDSLSGKGNQGLTAEAKMDLTGLGPIRVGMTIAEAVAAGGVALVSSTRKDKSCRYYEPEDGPKGISFMTVNDRIIRIDVWSDSVVSTLSGAHIGSTEAELNALYPGQIEVTANPFTQGKYLTYVPTAGSGEALYRLVFETNSAGKVTQFRTGQFPAVTWPKGCA
ncbi:MAG: hypothetical protein AAFW84_22440 [Cyanobacteria bacterium J06635_15]